MDDIYPDETIIKQDIENKDLYIGIVGGKIAVIYVINNYCDEEYNSGDWQYPDTEYRIIHRLCIHPDFQNKGSDMITASNRKNILCHHCAILPESEFY